MEGNEYPPYYFYSNINFHGRKNYNYSLHFSTNLKWSEDTMNHRLSFEDCNLDMRSLIEDAKLENIGKEVDRMKFNIFEIKKELMTD